MKVFWWQDGLHIEPKGKAEFDALMLLSNSLNVVDADQRPPRGPISDSRNEKSIGVMHKLFKMISNFYRSIIGVQYPLG
jgi:hypothetical protein